MNKEQLQEISNLKCKLTFALVDIVDICSQLGIDSQTPSSLINILDDAFRLINSVSDPEEQLNYLKLYFKKDFPQFVKWKNEVFPIFEQNAKEIKTKTIEAFQKNGEINEEINKKFIELNEFDEPYKNIDVDFFNYKKFIESLRLEGPFPFLDPIYKQVTNYETFLTILKSIKLLDKYKEICIDKEDSDKASNNTKNAKRPQNLPLPLNSKTLNQPISKLKDWGVMKIDNQPNNHPKEIKQDKDTKHHGSLSLSGLNLQHKDLKKKIPKPNIKEADQNLAFNSENTKEKNTSNQSNIEDPDRDFVNEYNAFVARIEGNGSKPTMTAEERIQARIQQKLMILEHESQILRDNLFIVTKQKEEMIQTYEKHIKEIEKQNKKLYEENEILKKKHNENLQKK